MTFASSGKGGAGEFSDLIEPASAPLHRAEMSSSSYIGTAGDDIIDGDAAGNFLTGLGGNDRLSGNGGNDFLTGGFGNDVLDGGAGYDTANYSDSDAEVNVDLATGAVSGGRATGDTLISIDSLVGGDFNDRLAGDAGGNQLAGGAGDDHLSGQGDNDFLLGDDGADSLFGGAGDDTLFGGEGADTIDGGDGRDIANYRYSEFRVQVDIGAGRYFGGEATGDQLISIEGVIGSDSNDWLASAVAGSRLEGGLGDDHLTGKAGDDVLFGGKGIDQLYGSSGNDVLEGGAGADTLSGGGNIDTASYAGSGAAVRITLLDGVCHFGDAENDALASIENLVGSAFNDVMGGSAVDNRFDGGAGNDGLYGSSGNDVLVGGAGADVLNGGGNIDTAFYEGSAAFVTVSLADGLGHHGDAEGDTLVLIENLVGSGRDDGLGGNAGANALSGGAGNDALTGGAGGDRLTGGAGNDRFIYLATGDSTVTAAGKDVIADFTTGDRIDLSAIDANGAAAGNGAFIFGTGALTGVAGELRVVVIGAVQLVGADTNGDRQLDFAINVTADHSLTAADFVL
jgi:Ca2+-binding RTX toxin-like protein